MTALPRTPSFRLDGRRALVTGAGRGIGRAATLALASQGAAVAVVSRTQSEMDEVIAEVRAHGGKAIASLLDVSNWDMVNWTAQQIAAARQNHLRPGGFHGF